MKLEEFKDLAIDLITEFNKVAEVYVSELSSKIEIAKELNNKLDQRINTAKSFFKIKSKYDLVLLLLELGYEPKEFLNYLTLSEQEKKLILEKWEKYSGEKR